MILQLAREEHKLRWEGNCKEVTDVCGMDRVEEIPTVHVPMDAATKLKFQFR